RHVQLLGEPVGDTTQAPVVGRGQVHRGPQRLGPHRRAATPRTRLLLGGAAGRSSPSEPGRRRGRFRSAHTPTPIPARCRYSVASTAMESPTGTWGAAP